jgi:kanamycin kinase
MQNAYRLQRARKMKRTLLEKIPQDLPHSICEFIGDSPIYDSSCSREARVYFIDKGDGFYLKRSEKGTLLLEAKMTDYFHKKGFGAEVVEYISSDLDYMLTRRVVGEDCTYADYLADPKRLSALLGERLRALHETDAEGCPVTDRMGAYISLAEKNYKNGSYDLSYFTDSYGKADVKEVWEVFQNGKNELKNEVLLHGDYCLPNVMLDNWRFSAFIDVGNGGIGDRHIDLFWGAWTLRYNLKTDEYRDRFFDAYGRDKINLDKIKTIAAGEVFG